MNLEFIKADIAYFEKIFEAERICFPNEFWSMDNIKSELENDRNVCILAVSDNKVCGYIFFSTVCDECELNRIAVLPDCRNVKIGKRLIEKMKEFCIEISASKIFLEVRNGNEHAIKLYSNAGFIKIGKRKNYYKNPTEDALLMSLKLN